MSYKPAATKAIVKGLADYLLANMPSLKKAYYNFPNPTEKLEYPALSVFTRTPTFTPISPYVIGKTEPTEVERQVTVTKVIGRYDFTLQVDLWTAYKAQRDQLYEEMFLALSQDPEVPGLSLELSEYYDEWARFDIDQPEFVDDESGSQRNEWRVIVRVQANCRAVREYLAHLMETIENNLETPDVIEESPEEDPDTMII